MVVVLELVNGVQLGIEYVSGEEDDEYTHAVVLNLSVFRLVFLNMKA
jgi:hypothetical protein